MPQGVEHWLWIDRIGVLVFDATLSTTLFLSLVLLAMLGCRQPARRILIARAALLASLAIIPLVALEPFPRLDLVDVVVESNLFPTALVAPVERSPSPRGDPAGGLDGIQRMPNRVAGSGVRAGLWIARGLILLDIACVVAGSAWLFLGFAGVHWLIRRSEEPSLTTREVHDQVIAGGSRAAARSVLRVSRRVQHPVVVGWLRPTILIPASLDQPAGDGEPLRLSLLHEIAHAERSDHWFGTVASLAQTVWFFLPQVWWLRSQLLIDQEFLADRAAAQRYGRSSDYASSLLTLAARRRAGADGRDDDPAPSWPASGKVGIQSPLFQRVLMLLHCPFPIEARAPRVWSWSWRLIIIGASVATAGLFVRWPNAAAVEPRRGLGARAASQSFRVTHLVAEPQVGPPTSRSLPYVVPLTLPPEFDLTVEVRSRRADLAQIRIAGHPLGDPHAHSSGDFNRSPVAADEAKTWHRVHLRSRRHEVSLAIDGKPISAGPRTEPAIGWLTIEPGPQNAAEFRDLVVSW
jgi:beta-lactamase regulating signal transducer with metallopeptidase domain